MLVVWFVLRRTTFGFETITVGTNPHAAHYAGINVGRIIILAMALSGGFAGLAAVSRGRRDQLLLPARHVRRSSASTASPSPCWPGPTRSPSSRRPSSGDRCWPGRRSCSRRPASRSTSCASSSRWCCCSSPPTRSSATCSASEGRGGPAHRCPRRQDGASIMSDDDRRARSRPVLVSSDLHRGRAGARAGRLGRRQIVGGRCRRARAPAPRRRRAEPRQRRTRAFAFEPPPDPLQVEFNPRTLVAVIGVVLVVAGVPASCPRFDRVAIVAPDRSPRCSRSR